MTFKFFIGCDIGKSRFTYCIRTTEGILEQAEVENTRKGVKKWLRELKKRFDHKTVLFGLECTGIYSYILLSCVDELRLTCCLENARNIKLSLGLQRGKNDKVDAQRISEYLIRYLDKVKIWSPKKEQVQQLQLLVAKRRQLVKAKTMLTQFDQESKRFISKSILKPMDDCNFNSSKALNNDIQQIDQKMQQVINSDANLKRITKCATSVPGVGMQTACEFIIRTNEFKDYDNAKKIACTAGVVPFEHSSGTSVKGKNRVSQNAQKSFKTLLHMAAMAAVRHPGMFNDYFIKKVDEGKNKMSVLNAVRNKIIHCVFAVVRDNVMYDKKHQYMFG